MSAINMPVAAPGHVLCYPYKGGEQRTDGGIVLPANAQMGSVPLEVINYTSSENNNQIDLDLQPGDQILVRGYKSCGVEYKLEDKTKVLIVPQQEVLAFIKGRVTGEGDTLEEAIENARSKCHKKACAA